MTQPRVSVVVPCHNYEQYLDGCLSSALGQEGVDLDVTVVDDASTDSSRDIVRRWMSTDSRIRLIEHPVNKGHIETFNESLFSAGAPYVVKLDPDDLLTKGSLLRSAQVLEDHPSVSFVYGGVEVFEGDPPHVSENAPWGARIVPGREWLRWMAGRARNPILQPEIMIRRSALAATGGHRADVPAASDFNLWLRLAAHGDVARIEGAVQGLYRLHAGSMQRTIHSGRLEDLRSRVTAFEVFFRETPGFDDLRPRAARTLARDARELAFEELDAGRDPGPLMDEGRALHPPIAMTPAWRSLEHQVSRHGTWWTPAGRAFRQFRWRARWWRRWATRRRGAIAARLRSGDDRTLRRTLARLTALLLTAVTGVVDAGPDIARFGKGRGLRNRLLRVPLPTLDDAAAAVPPDREGARKPPRATAVLVTRTLGRGGVEAVVAALARDLPAHGIDVIVVCERGGVTADELRAGGVAVRECSDEGDVAAVLARVEGPRVVELHNAPSYAVVACRRMGVPHVPVVHTTDINLNPSQWMAAADVLADAQAAVAVSATVRDFTLAGLPPSLGDVFTVIPNGVNPLAISATDRARARAGLSDALGAELGDRVVALCLARYDMQKNIPGLVAAFLRSTGTDAILVVAGPVEDWLEHRLAHALAVAQGAEHRVRLLGTSSSSALLAAADVFVLDSFFEGWPVAVTEAAVAGIPLVVAEVGGTRELVGESGERGRRVANPGGNPRTITLREIRRARRHVRRQANSTAFADALDEVIAHIEEWRLRRDDLAADARERFGSSAMVAKHAGLVMEIAGLSTAAEPVLQGEGKST